MPLFEYRCHRCQTAFALLEGVTAQQPKRECPHCGGRKLTKLISRPARIVKSDDLDSGTAGADDHGDFGDDLGDEFPDDGLDDE